MNGIKNMLLGIAIMLAVIVFHLFCANDGLWTDFIAIIGLIYVCGIKKEKISLPKEKNRCIAAVFETAGQFFYTYAMASNSTISAALVSSYCIMSLILSRIFLKEHLTWKQYVLIAIVFVGIILTSI